MAFSKFWEVCINITYKNFSAGKFHKGAKELDIKRELEKVAIKINNALPFEPTVAMAFPPKIKYLSNASKVGML